jgi:hypothetical protein
VPDAVIHATAVVGDRQLVIERLDAIRRSAAPDLFVLAMNGYSTAAALIAEAAPLIHAAGFALATFEDTDGPRTRPFIRPVAQVAAVTSNR